MLRLVLPIPESVAGEIRLGDPVKVHVQALNQDYVGKVSRFADSLDPQTRTMETEIDFQNADGRLLPGMYVRATLAQAEKKEMLTIPLEAVQANGSEGTVLLVNSQNTLKSESSARFAGKHANRSAIRPETGRPSGNWKFERISRRDESATERNRCQPARRNGRPVMPKFALAYPYFIIMICLVVAVVGVTTVSRMPVDLFPEIKIPVVVVATFYAGMPPQQIEADITNTFERFFTLGSNIDHIESRSLTGVSLIKIYFKPGTDANAALSNIAISQWPICGGFHRERCRLLF